MDTNREIVVKYICNGVPLHIGHEIMNNASDFSW